MDCVEGETAIESKPEGLVHPVSDKATPITDSAPINSRLRIRNLLPFKPSLLGFLKANPN
jgi:hypothetical protein